MRYMGSRATGGTGLFLAGVCAFAVNALFPHWPFLYDLIIGVVVGAGVGVAFGQLMGYLLTPRAIREEEHPHTQP